jgi:HEXXH motif-containing protein
VTHVDWARVAVPQPDGYETDVALALAGRGLPGFAWVEDRGSHAARSVAFDGAVTVAHVLEPCPYDGLENAPLDAPAIVGASTLLRRWPEMFRQVQRLVRYLQPLRHPTAPPWQSSSGCREDQAGLILVTVEHPLTLAEAIVHETAHLRLHALGIGVERATGLILNPSDRLYESPVIRDRPRPITAVFHAQFTFCHIAWLDVLMLEGEVDDEQRAVITSLLAHSLVRIERGVEILRDHLELDDDGAAFVGAFSAWCDRVIARGRAALAHAGHPGAELPPFQQVAR